jgi:DNA-directed RNA polymerase specialized sigma24 family protein
MDRWIDITSCEDGADRVLLHEKTGQRKVVKPADRTVLDDAYDAYWNSPRSLPDPTDLLAVVRAFTMKAAKHDEDIAQGVAMIVFEGLETFSRADATAFTRWVRSIVKRVGLEHYRTSSDHTDEFKEAAMEQPSEEAYADISELPDELKRIAAFIIEGYSLSEIAERQSITSDALRNKLARFRKSPLRKAA